LPVDFIPTEDWVTVELLPLELLEVAVAVVSVVKVDTADGELILALV
jgi:hypothetical protein